MAESNGLYTPDMPRRWFIRLASIRSLTYRSPRYRGGVTIQLRAGLLTVDDRGSYTLPRWQWGPPVTQLEWWPADSRFVNSLSGPGGPSHRASFPLWIPAFLAATVLYLAHRSRRKSLTTPVHHSRGHTPHTP